MTCRASWHPHACAGIEQAKGVLATQLGITTSEAFDRMRRHARAHRRRIQDVADDVVTGHDDLIG